MAHARDSNRNFGCTTGIFGAVDRHQHVEPFAERTLDQFAAAIDHGERTFKTGRQLRDVVVEFASTGDGLFEADNH